MHSTTALYSCLPGTTLAKIQVRPKPKKWVTDQSARSTNQGKLARCRNRKHTPVGVESSLANLLAMC